MSRYVRYEIRREDEAHWRPARWPQQIPEAARDPRHQIPEAARDPQQLGPAPSPPFSVSHRLHQQPTDPRAPP
eukprot:1190740-Prorocentrum_minimum.AAC.1